ncbi:glycerol kinase GlpK [Silvibacterium dinghuense]|uniref:Glycerol kinase n=1 Tax=Silvibacterium dinghuense TaxID=1560006 RepID=A0A4Q1SFH6_9BACT|nr:glycerol kinase GlpK [Silvibacterium dinghuense]RXS95628.1 glycerol kinase [Silvibacterium dinghuense]GGH14520.1 glycerol kinase [Silvibacterium dinghuense]
MNYILALDQGTTSSRAILFTRDGRVHAQAQHEFEQIYPKSGWVEHDPYAILTSQLTAAVEVLGKSRIRPRDVAAMGITNQRETTIVWNRHTGKPVYNAIVWQDRRTAEFCSQLAAQGASEMVRQRTGLLIDSYFSGTKIRWILDHVEGAREQAERGELAFGTVDSWLIWNLTSGKQHVTDRTNASRTLLYNIVEDRWDAELLRLLDIPESMMPRVIWSSEQVGAVSTTLGLGEIEIAGIAGDQQSALFGQLCLNPGDAKNTYGTGCFLLENIGTDFALSQKQLVTTLTCSLERKLTYAYEGSIFIGGAVVQWLRDNLGLIRHSSDIEALAQTVESSEDLVLVPAFVGLGAPHWDPHAAGLLIGLRRNTQPGHIARAALESIAFQVADVLEAMNQDTSTACKELRVDGGASANNLLMQFQADLLGIPVVRPEVVETTALGAAYLAGLASGFWSSPEEIWKLRDAGHRFEPQLGTQDARARRERWQNAVERSKRWDGA